MKKRSEIHKALKESSIILVVSATGHEKNIQLMQHVVDDFCIHSSPVTQDHDRDFVRSLCAQHRLLAVQGAAALASNECIASL